MPIEFPEITWRALAPVISLSTGAVVTLMVGVFMRRTNRVVLATLTLLTAGVAAFFTFDLAGERHVGLNGMIASDGVALFTNLILLFSVAIVVLGGFGYLSARRIHRAEFYPLLLLATAGMVLLASSNDLLMVFVSLELLSLALFILVALARRDAGAQEGALKYFLLGAFSSAILLYGLALVYGAVGTTNVSRLASEVLAPAVDERLLFAGLALLGVGFAFKIGAVPFHMWTPDAYQGAPTPVTAFMAAGTKAAGFAALLRVFLVAFGPLQWDWRPAFFVISIATMVLGSFVAIAQTDVKRMLAYSSIAHAGFILVGFVAASPDGLAGSLFYLLVYAATTLGAFGVVAVSAPRGAERLDLGSWTGIGHRHPVFAGAMTLFLLSLAGIPPTGGFMGKFFVFSAAARAGETGLVVAGVLASAVAAFFYIRLIVLMWMQESTGEQPGLGLTQPALVSLAITAVVTLGAGVWPQQLIELARRAAVFTG